MVSSWGRFPFGRENTQRPMRVPGGTPKALVVGVYPSALHIAWSPPPHLDPRPEDQRQQPYIRSLAIDVEPVVFWDGASPAPDAEVERWKAAVGFTSAWGNARPGNNGPSGARLQTNILDPLGLDSADVAYTDAVPWFFIKGGTRSQGDAIANRFAPVAAALDVHEGSLPARPSSVTQIAAGDERRQSLRSEILDSGAPLVITLGQEALDSVMAVADASPTGAQARLAPDGYGAVGDLRIGGRHLQFLPLVHPGFERQTKHEGWRTALGSWRSQLAGDD